MAKIIRHAEYIEETYHRIVFPKRDSPGGAWMVECDKDGRIDEEKLPGPARKIWEKIKERRETIARGEDEEYLPHRVVEFTDRYWTNVIVQCDCGEEIELYRGSDSTCDRCGAEYNSAGQQLAPRSQWGEETGEDWRDIVRPYHDDEDF